MRVIVMLNNNLDLLIPIINIISQVNLYFYYLDKSKKKSKKKSLGEIQATMKCQLEPSDEIIKLEYKDWPLLFKVCNIKYILSLLYLLNIFNNLI